jgi:hypothetical protein
MKINLLSCLLIFIICSTSYSDIYFKSYIDNSYNIALVKIVDVKIGNLEDQQKATAKVIKTLKGNPYDTLQLTIGERFSWAYFPSFHNSSIALLFFPKLRKNHFSVNNFQIISTSLIDTSRYANLPENITFPYRVIKSSFYRRIDTCRWCPDTADYKYSYSEWKVNLDTLLNSISDLITDPALPHARYNWFFANKYVHSRYKEAIEGFIKKHKDLNDVDRIAMYDYKFGKGVSYETIKFLCGKPNSILKIDKDREQWTYKGPFVFIFSLPDRKLLDLIKVNGL